MVAAAGCPTGVIIISSVGGGGRKGKTNQHNFLSPKYPVLIEVVWSSRKPKMKDFKVGYKNSVGLEVFCSFLRDDGCYY